MSDVQWVRGQRVFLEGKVEPAAIRIEGGRFHSIHPFQAVHAPSGTDVIEAGTNLLSPGLVDSHVHINEPGRTEWEGFDSATAAAAAGGITTVVDMPLNCIPATTSAEAARQKRRSVEGRLRVDVAFWGGVVPGNASELEGLANFGVPGCKCFTCPSGVDEFPHVTQADLELALPRLRDLGLMLLVHAEAPGPLERAEQAAAGGDPRDYATYLKSRPQEAEDQAIAMIIDLCRRHHARAHIVHLSSASALPQLRRAQQEGVQISAETCLHYLSFTSEQIASGATHFKCAPPIRDGHNRELLWRGLEDGTISMIVSDHSPCTPALKKMGVGDFSQAWGGISSLQLGLSACWTLVKARGHGLNELFRWSAQAPAALAGLGQRKGRIAPGFDADFVIWDDAATWEVNPQTLLHRNKTTPYAGRQLSGVVHQTFVRGQRVFEAPHGLSSVPTGQFLAVAVRR